jgi:hypothetical protein
MYKTPELDVLRNWIRNQLADDDPLSCDLKVAADLENYVEQLTNAGRRRHDVDDDEYGSVGNEYTKLAELDKPELLYLLRLLIGINRGRVVAAALETETARICKAPEAGGET